MKSSSTSTKTPSKTNPLYPNVFPKSVVAFTSDRSVDFVFPEESNELSPSQKGALEEYLGFPLAEVMNIRQVHGNHIHVISEKFLENKPNFIEADGVVTHVRQVTLTIRTADCLPVFLYDLKKHVMGLIHAGWRGSEKQIVRHALKLMMSEYHCKPGDVKIAFGPCIRSCCYEVSEDFLLKFPMETREQKKRYYLDLAAVNKNQLLETGLDENHFFDCQICTFCNKQYFSYRRDGKSSGRMLSLMMMK